VEVRRGPTDPIGQDDLDRPESVTHTIDPPTFTDVGSTV
jgi:hypothetical protein